MAAVGIKNKKYGIVFDVETTGLPKGKDWKKRDHFKTCRMVSIAWEVINMNDREILEKKHYYIKPVGFVIPERAIDIHGITNEKAHQFGKNVEYIMSDFFNDINKHNVTTIIAHNINFDLNVVLSELYHVGFMKTLYKVQKLDPICTMREGRKKLSLKKNPKLCDLFKMLTKKEMEIQHSADADTRACTECVFNLSLL